MRYKVQENPPAIYDQQTGRVVLVLAPCQVFPGRLCGICRKEESQEQGTEEAKSTESQP
jgi:hypothetical protein